MYSALPLVYIVPIFLAQCEFEFNAAQITILPKFLRFDNKATRRTAADLIYIGEMVTHIKDRDFIFATDKEVLTEFCL